MEAAAHDRDPEDCVHDVPPRGREVVRHDGKEERRTPSDGHPGEGAVGKELPVGFDPVGG